jgi:hypothetical protein
VLRLTQELRLVGLNDAGQLLYHLYFADGSGALSIATVPEPAALLPLILAVVSIARRHRRSITAR